MGLPISILWVFISSISPRISKGRQGLMHRCFLRCHGKLAESWGGEEALRELIKEAGNYGIQIIADLIPHVNQNFKDLPEWAIVKSRSNGRIIRRLATDGSINHENGLPVEWHDSVMLNYRDSGVIECLIGLVRRLATMGIAGVRIDVAHNFGSMLPVEQGLEGKQKLFGHIASWDRNEAGGYRIVNDWDTEPGKSLS